MTIRQGEQKMTLNESLIQLKLGEFLLDAARRANLGLVKLLIKSGANVHTEGAKGRTLFHYAAENGWLGIVELLLARDLDPNLEDAIGFKPLHYAAENAKLEVIKLLISKGAHMNDSGNAAGMTALHLAVRSLTATSDEDSQEVIKFLLENDANYDIRDIHNRTALSYAISDEDSETIKIFRAYAK